MEARLSARVNELARELAEARADAASANRRAERANARSGVPPRTLEDEETSARHENEVKRLEGKLRAAKADGSARTRALEQTVASLRSRSGLHAEVARLGEELGRVRLAESRHRRRLEIAEEKLGNALLDLRDAEDDGAGPSSGEEKELSSSSAEEPSRARTRKKAKLPERRPETARRVGAEAIRESAGAADDFAAAVPDAGTLASGDFGSHASLAAAKTDRDASRYRAEIERLRGEVESAALERGREAAARVDASRELASALDRVAERGRAARRARVRRAR